MKRTTTAIALFAALCLPLAARAEQTAQSMPEMSAEDQAMMAAMEKAATPGKQHEWLASLAGTWEFTTRFYPAPGAPPMESRGTAERKVQLGGRIIVETVRSEFMGQQFEGFGLTGYDNVTGSYWGTWSDNMSTGIMMSKGSCDDHGSCTFTGEYADPMTGKMVTNTMVSKHSGDSEHHEFWETRDGEKVKTMELHYTRKQ